MIKILPVKIKPQYIDYSQTAFKGFKLHKIQELFYNYDNLPQISIITAPTGTGKSFAFPLPLINNSGLSKKRGLVVSPTNALIQNMKSDFDRIFPNNKTEILNAQRLDEMEAFGKYNRWNAILKIIDEAELIITNPDLLNYAMMGGYFMKDKVTQRQWTELLEKINYFIFDEYHLYDEEQITNILCWLELSQALFPEGHSKFVFVSATPEIGLEEYLNQSEIPFSVCREEITDSGRKIHGQINVKFIRGSEIHDYLIAEKALIYDFVSKGNKILVLFDSLVQLQRVEHKIKQTFRDLKVEIDSGYETRSNITPDLENAQIILGTNKLEVGVNLNVDICFMEPGLYFRNFIQRFGRIARGDREGYIYVFVKSLNQLQKEFQENEILTYYNFTDKAGNVFKEKKFYTEKIPQFMGCAFYVIQKNVADPALWNILKDKLTLTGFANSFRSFFIQINGGIKKLEEINKNSGLGFSGDLIKWQLWWYYFLETFKFFRGGSINCKVIDLDKGIDFQCEYSLEWILRNKNIVEIKEKQGEKIYIVEGLTDEKQQVAKVVNSLPIPGISNNVLLDKDRFKLKDAYTRRLKEVQDFYISRPDEFSRQCLKLVELLDKIKPIFNVKRLNVEEVIAYSNIL